jgi:alkanesulfonate monooxygenase SsuD/methylene tetrahydromethanopterin reductase-like flavin-dependent oxidoreductase (luciferase family)
VKLGLIIIPDRWPDTATLVRDADDAGGQAVYAADHLRHPRDRKRPVLDRGSVIAGLASITHRVRPGLLVANLIYRNPMLVARQAVTLDHQTGGRFERGLGAGVYDDDHTLAGIGLDQRPRTPPTARRSTGQAARTPRLPVGAGKARLPVRNTSQQHCGTTPRPNRPAVVRSRV